MKLAFLALAAAAVCVSQAQEPPVFRSTTRLVQVNVVAHDKKGPVSDLKKEDFIVLDKGKPQSIAFFAVESATRLTNPTIKLPENVFSNRFGEHRDVPQSVTVILLDALNTEWAHQAYARQHVLSFLKQIQPNERVALYTLGQGLRVLHDYTSDASSLIERLNRWAAVPDDFEISKTAKDRQNPIDDLLPAELIRAEQNFANFITGTKVVNTLRTLETIAEHLAAVPGRKSLIWVSGGFPLMLGFDELNQKMLETGNFRTMPDPQTFFEETERAVRALNAANIAVYPVDARGLMVDPRYSAARRGQPGNQSWSPPHLDTMRHLANRTGGKAYFDRNDIDGAISEVFADAKVTYTLGFYPAESDDNGRFRDIQVKVSRPGVSLRYRKGYFSFGELRADDKTIQAEMNNAVWSPLDATAVPLNARVDLIKGENVCNVVSQIDPTKITLKQVGGRWRGRVDLVMVQKAEDGRALAGVSRTIELDITKETYTRVFREGLLCQSKMPVNAGALILRIVVRDAPSGLAGSLTIPLNKVVPFTPQK